MSEERDIQLSRHAEEQMRLRGATEAEIIASVRNGTWAPALRGKKQVRLTFPFNSASPINGKTYAFKTVDCVVAEETDRYVVVTVKVYYGQEQGIAP